MGCSNGSEPKPGFTGLVWIDTAQQFTECAGANPPWYCSIFGAPSWAEDVETLCSSPPPSPEEYDLPINDFSLAGVATRISKFTEYARARAWIKYCKCRPAPSSCAGTWVVRVQYGNGQQQDVNARPGLESDTFSVGITSAPQCPSGQAYTVFQNGIDPQDLGVTCLPNTMTIVSATFTKTDPNCDSENNTPDPDPVLPPVKPAGLPDPPAQICQCQDGEKGDKGDKGDKGEDGIMQFENVDIQVLECDDDGKYKTEPLSISVPKSDEGSTGALFQALFEGLAKIAIQNCPPPNLTSLVLSEGVEFPGTSLSFPVSTQEIRFTTTVQAPWVSRRLGENSSGSNDDKFSIGGYSIGKDGFKGSEIPLQWTFQREPVNGADGVRVYVNHGFSVRVEALYLEVE